MIKKTFIIIGLLLVIVLGFIAYFTLIGIETNKFNTFIKNEIKSYNNKFDVNLNKVKLILDIKEFNINIDTTDPTIIYNNQKIKLKKISFSFSINSYLNKTFGIKKAEVASKYNKINNFLDIYRQVDGSSQSYILSQIIKDGEISFNAKIEFDEKGKILPNYVIIGDIKKTNLGFLKNYNLQNLGFKYKISKDNYTLKNVLFNFNKIIFKSNKILIEKKNKYYLVKGNLKNKKQNLNQEILSVIIKNNLNNLNIDKAKIFSEIDFSFKINKKIKIKNFNINSKVNISDLKYSFNSKEVKKYFPEYKGEIYFRDNIFDIRYSKKNFEVIGSNNYSLNDLSNKLNFKINNFNNLYNFDFDINLDNNKVLLNQINYSKNKNKKANLKIRGKYTKNKDLVFSNINFIEGKNSLIMENLQINKNYKIIKFDKIANKYITTNKIKNDYSIILNKKKYIISGGMYDGIKLINNMFEDGDTNVFDAFLDLNNQVTVNFKKFYLDKKNYVNNLKASINFNDNKINSLNLDSNFPNNKKITLTINTTENNEKVTTLFSSYPKPLVKRYKFIKGFEEGVLDFQSIKKNNISKSVLKIDNFKVKEVPALAKLLSLASLQGIADVLTGEGIRFTDFEMIFSNKDKLMTIDEIYAIGPAVSILLEGYIEKNKLISLRGTLVPATTINRTIASIPLLGDILIGKKVGEGVFGVSFKIKGPPKNLKTTVNPIKTLTPRFITRTLKKIKKN